MPFITKHIYCHKYISHERNRRNPLPLFIIATVEEVNERNCYLISVKMDNTPFFYHYYFTVNIYDTSLLNIIPNCTK